MKKTLTVLIMVLLAAMLIISCDNSTNEPKKEDSSTTPTETPTTPTTPAEPTPSTYMVTFRLGESSSTGSAFDAQEIVGGEKAQKPATNPIATDKYKTFDFWSADNGATEFKFDETAITKDIVLQAVYRDYEVGDTGPAGGIIFYDVDADNNIETVDKAGARKKNLDGLTSSECDWRYLEVSPSDLSYTDNEDNVSNSFIFGINWPMATGNPTMETCGASEDQIGKGKTNTATLVQKMGNAAGTSLNKGEYMSNTSVYAAKLCADYGKDTEYNDWFLPSRYELNALYTEYKNGKIGGTWHSEKLSSGYVAYWSSTESNKVNAYTVDFSDGTERTTGRQDVNNRYVRAVRAF